MMVMMMMMMMMMNHNNNNNHSNVPTDPEKDQHVEPDDIYDCFIIFKLLNYCILIFNQFKNILMFIFIFISIYYHLLLKKN